MVSVDDYIITLCTFKMLVPFRLLHLALRLSCYQIEGIASAPESSEFFLKSLAVMKHCAVYQIRIWPIRWS